jgi:hypothetical protein
MSSEYRTLKDIFTDVLREPSMPGTFVKSALELQVGGSHYKDMRIQPVEFIHANNIGYLEGNVIKYVSRWKSKNGIADLEKAKHYIELLIELATKEESAEYQIQEILSNRNHGGTD